VRRILVLLLIGTAGLVAFTRVPVRAQSDAKPLTFEVASVKPSSSDEAGGSMGFQPGGRFRAMNIPAQSLIAVAYGNGKALLASQIAGAPAWLATSRFNIQAKVSGDVASPAVMGPAQMAPTLRALLEDRFKLKAHMETRDEPIYELVKARADGRLGPGLRASGVDCLALLQQRRDNPSTARPLPSPCTAGLKASPGMFSAGSTTISNLVPTLSNAVERMVLDRTGLVGNFAIDLKWTPSGLPAEPSSGDVPPSIFTAVQEQLGLKLMSAKGPVDVLVIDHVEHPSED
jgi:uncharacterized protein (TIGR03435 family)